MSSQQQHEFLDVAVGIITALPLEAQAARGVFDEILEESQGDEEEPRRSQLPIDWNSYTLGLIGKHKVVLAHMPGMGKVKAVSVVSTFRTNFPGANLVLLLGICGVTPTNSD